MSTLVPNGVNTPEIMRTELTDQQREARERIYAMPLEALDPANASESGRTTAPPSPRAGAATRRR